MAAVVNNARRGVGNIGLLASLSLKFCDKSAASDVPGEEPGTALPLKYSRPGSWKVNWFLPSGLGTRCGPKRLDWPKLVGGAGRIAASGEDVSMALQDNGACTDAAVCSCTVWAHVVVDVKRDGLSPAGRCLDNVGASNGDRRSSI